MQKPRGGANNIDPVVELQNSTPFRINSGGMNMRLPVASKMTAVAKCQTQNLVLCLVCVIVKR